MKDAMTTRNAVKVTFSSLLIGRDALPHIFGRDRLLPVRVRHRDCWRLADCLLRYAMPVSPNTWTNFAVVAFLVSLLPGPAFIIVLSTALRRGFRSALYANAGVVAGDAAFFFFSALLLGSLFAPSLFWLFLVNRVRVIHLIFISVLLF